MRLMKRRNMVPRIPKLPPLSNRTVRDLCSYVLRHTPGLFDGWPTARVYDAALDGRRVARIKAASPALALVQPWIVFDVCSSLAAQRRMTRRMDYEQRVQRVMAMAD